MTNFDGEFTGASGNDYRYTDRDVVIALQGVQVANARGGNFTAAATYEVGGFPVTITRGWVSVDATIDGKNFRFASAHPDDADADAQRLQAEQFLDEVSTTLPLVAVGDFSHPPPGETRPAYGILTAPATGLVDTYIFTMHSALFIGTGLVHHDEDHGGGGRREEHGSGSHVAGEAPGHR